MHGRCIHTSMLAVLAICRGSLQDGRLRASVLSVIKIGAPSATIDSPVEHLMACHRRIEDRLDTLVRAADYLESDRDSALAAIAKSLQFLDSSGVQHTMDEEDSVFPRLRERVSADQVAYLDSLEQDHEHAESVLASLRLLVQEAVRQSPVEPTLIDRYRACAEDLRLLYRRHIRSEDEILTAMAKQNLSQKEIAEISDEMRTRRQSRTRLATSRSRP